MLLTYQLRVWCKKWTAVLRRSWQGTTMGLAMLIATLIFLILGSIFAGDQASDAQRDALVAAYNRSLTIWELSGRRRFERMGNVTATFDYTVLANTSSADYFSNSEINATISDVIPLTTTIPLAARGDYKISLRDPADVAVERSYQPLSYNFTGPMNITATPWQEIKGTITITSSAGTWSLPIDITREINWGGTNWKICVYQKRGAYFYEADTNPSVPLCYTYLKMSSLCIALAWSDTDMTWKPDKVVPGCWESYSQPMTFELIPVPFNQGPRSVAINSFSAALYSVEDPILVAYKLTNGTLSFGMTHKERVGAAIAFFCVSAFTFFAATAIVVCCFKEWGYFSAPEDRYTARMDDLATVNRAIEGTIDYGETGVSYASARQSERQARNNAKTFR